jgi:arsenite methyltransferase
MAVAVDTQELEIKVQRMYREVATDPPGVGAAGSVTGVDFTAEQLAKARGLAAAGGFDRVGFLEGRIERLPAATESTGCVISNGVTNLAPDKRQIFAEAARVLRAGGRLAIADIVSEQQLTDAIVCDADL